MLKSSILAWSGPQVADQLHTAIATVKSVARRHNIGIRPGSHQIYELCDVHCIAWCLLRSQYRGPMPWTLPEAPPMKRRKLYVAREVAEIIGCSVGNLRGILMKTSAIGHKIGHDVVFTLPDIQILHERLATPGVLHPEDSMVRDHSPRKIKLDTTLFHVYDGLVEAYMDKKPGRDGRTKNMLSVYFSDELVDWLETRRLKKPYLAKSQVVLEAVQELYEQEQKNAK